MDLVLSTLEDLGLIYSSTKTYEYNTTYTYLNTLKGIIKKFVP